MFKKILACAAIFVTALTLMSCSSNTPSGKKYTEKSSNMEEAVSAVEAADTKTDALPDISYEMFYKIIFRDLTGETILGTKNTVSASKKGTDDVSALITKTLYGTTSSTENVFAYKNGMGYIKMYDSDFSAETPYDDFCVFTDNQSYTTDKTYLDVKYFSKVKNYTLEDGSSEIVFSSPSAELLSMIAKFIGLDSSDYVYNITDTSLTVNIKPNGEISDKHLTFIASYYDEDTPEQKVVYNGDFSYTVEKTSDVTFKMPSWCTDTQKISSLSLLKKFSSGYIVLASITDLDATYDRYIKYYDLSGNIYESRDQIHFTEGYRDGKYLYGSIDERYLFLNVTEKDIVNETSTSSTGYFLKSDGKYYERSSDGDDENGTKPSMSDEEFIYIVYVWLSSELATADEITKMKITETDDTVTYTYSFNSQTIPIYAEYLLGSFTTTGESPVDLSESTYYEYKNQCTVTIRKSDGCIISQTVDFDFVFSNSFRTTTSFKMTVNATGDDVKILDVSDWGNHSFGDQEK